MQTLVKDAIAAMNRDTEIAFAYNTLRGEFSFFDKKEMTLVINQWKKEIRAGNIEIGYENCATAQLNGKKYYTLVVQYKHHDIPIDPTGYVWENSSFVVNGYIYYFRRQSNRNNIIRWLNS
jgi:hypothetical protein